MKERGGKNEREGGQKTSPFTFSYVKKPKQKKQWRLEDAVWTKRRKPKKSVNS